MNQFSFFSLVGIAFCLQNCSVVKEKELIQKNDNFTSIQYTDSTCYSRSLITDGRVIYTANSNGKIYSYNIHSEKKRTLNSNTQLEELRDISIVNKFIFGLQSGTTGKLIEISPKNKIRIIEYDFWKGIFLDAMDFHAKTGFILGDPVDNKFSLFFSKDGGKSWNPCKGEVNSFEGEAAFAASGSTVQVLDDSTFIFVSGGSTSRYFKSTDCGKTWSNSIIPFRSGEITGAFSVCFKNNMEGVVVGGDHSKFSNSEKTSFYTTDGGISWNEAFSGLTGYKSCVYYKNGIYYSCGINGLDFSSDDGKNWTHLLTNNFFSMTANKHFLFVSGPKATITKIKLIK